MNLFLNFGMNNDANARPILRSIGRQLPSALDQLRDAKAFEKTKISSGRFLAFVLTAKGYAALGEKAAKACPTHEPFVRGMRDRAAEASDPPAKDFSKLFRQEGADEIHGMLLIAHDDAALALREADRWVTLLSFGGIREVGREVGLQHVNGAGEGIENFGYVDGRSQPLMLRQDIEQEAKKAGVAGDPSKHGSWRWSPIFPLGQALAPDKGGADKDASFGSFFVFRKLEQDVKGFKDRESEAAGSLADKLGLKAAGVPEASASAPAPWSSAATRTARPS